ncbi:MAG: hypothetical protein QOC62_372 [Mycobacterium sp.]|nr:hypothetical protein [Mycobacterium sp.]
MPLAALLTATQNHGAGARTTAQTAGVNAIHSGAQWGGGVKPAAGEPAGVQSPKPASLNAAATADAAKASAVKSPEAPAVKSPKAPAIETTQPSAVKSPRAPAMGATYAAAMETTQPSAMKSPKTAAATAVRGVGEVRVGGGRQAQRSGRENSGGGAQFPANALRRPGEPKTPCINSLHAELLLYVGRQHDGS